MSKTSKIIETVGWIAFAAGALIAAMYPLTYDARCVPCFWIAWAIAAFALDHGHRARRAGKGRHSAMEIAP
jgi:hypothetical protein